LKKEIAKRREMIKRHFSVKAITATFLSALVLIVISILRVSGQIKPSEFLGGTCDDDIWTVVAVPPLPFLSTTNRAAVFTGEKLIVWGAGGFSGAGYVFDPGAGGWTLMNTVNQPNPTLGFTALWTGSVMLVFGATTSAGQVTAASGSYYPVTDAWTPISVAFAGGPQSNSAAVWTGSEVIFWSGGGGSRYDPGSDTSITVSSNGAPTVAANKPVTMVWTGREAIVFGSQLVQGAFVPSAGRYDPATDTWHPVSTANAPTGTDGVRAVWSGSQMVVWTDDGIAGRYDLATDTWKALPPVNLSVPQQATPTAEIVVWTGGEMLVWGQTISNHGARYDPVADKWRPVTTTDAPPPGNYTGVWAGTQLFVLGPSTTTPSGQPPTLFGGLYCSNAPPGCTYSFTPGSQSFGAIGGTGSFSVTASTSSCPLTETSNAPWVTISSGGGTVSYRVAANTDPNPRSGSISVSGQNFTINQAGGPHITGVSLDGKNLIVTGLNFDSGSLILVGGQSVHTLHDSQNPNTIIGKKGIKLIPAGQAAPIQVQNSDGATSDSFSFVR
jgi:hypothetical protein